MHVREQASPGRTAARGRGVPCVREVVVSLPSPHVADSRRWIAGARRILDALLMSQELPCPQALPEDCDPVLERLSCGVHAAQAVLASSLTSTRTSGGAMRRAELATSLRLLAADAACLGLDRTDAGLLEAASALQSS